MDLSRIEWRKASYSTSNGGACVEVGVWRTASYSSGNGGACVEVAPARDTAVAAHGADAGALCLVRDSRDPGGPSLAFTPQGWKAFTRRVRSGALDPG
ncbi:MAG TPA: DUF397 domain-containing protein [Streptosporangiaceae bacterium]|nr:DUF397 domain-containing protein [Streptosporangiaceae bacterium]